MMKIMQKYGSSFFLGKIGCAPPIWQILWSVTYFYTPSWQRRGGEEASAPLLSY